MFRVALYAPLRMQVKIQKHFDQMQARQICLEKSGIAFCFGMVGHNCILKKKFMKLKLNLKWNL
jgi:hypothetical protein